MHLRRRTDSAAAPNSLEGLMMNDGRLPRKHRHDLRQGTWEGGLLLIALDTKWPA